MAFEGLDALPDVKAFVAFYRTLPHSPLYPPTERLTRFLKLAHRMHSKPGAYFPVQVQQDQRMGAIS
jgi:hypothetical protein